MRGGNAGLHFRVGQELWSAQLSSAPTYRLTQAKGTIPDLVLQFVQLEVLVPRYEGKVYC